MAHDHEHHHHDGEHGGDAARRLLVAAALNGALAVAQLIGGLVLRSTAVLADAAHQAVDSSGLVLAVVSLSLARRPAQGRQTFGFGRADSLGAQLSALVLIASTGWIVIEGVRRLFDPSDVRGGGVVVFGLIGMAVNAGSLLAIGHQHGSQSVSAARLHLITDLGGSVAVAVAGVVVSATGYDRADTIIALALSVVVLHAAVRLVVSSGRVLLDRVPDHLDPDEVSAAMATSPGVTGIHHLHLWTIGPDEVAASAHVQTAGDLSVHDAQLVRDRLAVDLQERFGIGHLTVQIECHDCDDEAH